LGENVAKARRARVRPSRVVVPLLIAAVLLGGGIFAAVKYGSNATTAGPDVTPTVAATEATATPSPSLSPSPSPSTATPSSSSSTAAKPGVSTAVQKAKNKLRACEAGVDSADAVLAAAKAGVGHWAMHVQAQTDANARKISVDQMQTLFKKTRLAGPADERRYRDAVSAYEDAKASCSSVKGADRATAAALRSCQQRAEAQRPVLAAAANGMQDWKSHLAAMQRNREGHVANPEGVWLAAWRAAPPHINAYKKAAQDFDAPRC